MQLSAKKKNYENVYFSQQIGPKVARAIQSPARTTQRYARSSSSFSAGCASTLTAARTLASNCTTNGASGCRKPRKHMIRYYKAVNHSENSKRRLGRVCGGRRRHGFYHSPVLGTFHWDESRLSDEAT